MPSPVEILVIGASGLVGAALMEAAGTRAVGCASTCGAMPLAASTRRRAGGDSRVTALATKATDTVCAPDGMGVATRRILANAIGRLNASAIAQRAARL